MAEVITKCHSLPLLQYSSVVSHLSLLVCVYFARHCVKVAGKLCDYSHSADDIFVI